MLTLYYPPDADVTVFKQFMMSNQLNSTCTGSEQQRWQTSTMVRDTWPESFLSSWKLLRNVAVCSAPPLDDVLTFSISSDRHISALQGAVRCRKHRPLLLRWHHYLSGPSISALRLLEPSVLMITLLQPFHSGDEPPADGKQTSGPLSWSIIAEADCSTKLAAADSKQQLLRPWLSTARFPPPGSRALPPQKLHLY